MYLRLGNTKIKYTTQRDSFIIVGEIIDSTVGYESPVLVHSLDELDIWFGDNFTDREYLRELLRENNDLCLLLSRPISPYPPNVKTEGWIDYENFEIDKEVYYTEDQFPTVGQEGILYRKLENISGDSFVDYIWTGNFYIPVKDLPQNNQPENSLSFYNRDTLRIGWKDTSSSTKEWGYCYPPYEEVTQETKPETDETLDWNKIDLGKLDSQEETLAFDIKFPDPETFQIPKNYIVLENTIYYTGKEIPISNSYYTFSLKVDSVEDLKKAIQESGWVWNEEEDIIYKINGVPEKVTYFFSWETLSLEPNFKKTQDIISFHIDPVISFWSRTIGRARSEDWEEDNIHLKIEKVKQENNIWRATISRYNYTEVFEGTLEPSPKRLDFEIEKGSKLVHSYIPDNISPTLKELPEGEWQLKRSTSREDGTIKERLKYTINWMFYDNNNNFWADFFMIPNLSDWISTEEEAKETYSGWLWLAQDMGFQFLIQNTPENLELNYTEDKENRLVWFMNPIIIDGSQRPGYYLFLKGLLQDIYSITSTLVIYSIPGLTSDPYTEDITTEEAQLQKYKSNYLVCNNQIYYYKEYQNGADYDTTIWMRWTMGKITRELEKNKGDIIGNRTVGGIIENIQKILKTIQERFTIIRSIDISDYNISFREQKINLELQTTISDLRENSMFLDININYNKL